jgi:hypothetical protein
LLDIVTEPRVSFFVKCRSQRRIEEGTKDHVPLVASTIMLMPTAIIYPHVVREEKKDGPTFNINRPHQYSFVAPINEGNKANGIL